MSTWRDTGLAAALTSLFHTLDLTHRAWFINVNGCFSAPAISFKSAAILPVNLALQMPVIAGPLMQLANS